MDMALLGCLPHQRETSIKGSVDISASSSGETNNIAQRSSGGCGGVRWVREGLGEAGGLTSGLSRRHATVDTDLPAVKGP